jgi:CRISPR/Cas system CSM-associated protein Csm3 (group 7 of RAMP superfamily)
MPTKTDRVQITYDLTFTTLFHCGTGIRAGLVDRTVKRDGSGYLYVPGSTFKGVLREHCEQLARFYVGEAGRASIASPHDAETVLEDLGNRQPTMVTRLFGSQNVPGRIFFDDALLSEEEKKQYGRQDNGSTNRRGYKGLQVDLYTQVRLDRPTHTAVPGALYTSEFGIRDITFTGSILGGLECTAVTTAGLRNIRYPDQTPTYSLLILLAGLHMVERLGGNKSTGKGRCTCKIISFLLNGHEISEEVREGWLEQLDELAHYGKVQEERA